MCYIHYVVKGVISVKYSVGVESRAERALRGILADLGGFEVHVRQPSRSRHDLVVEADSSQQNLRFAIEAKRRITPQTAFELCQRLRATPAGLVPAMYAPAISPRVAEIARQHGVGFFDDAGNCWLHSEDQRLLIDRRGMKSERREEPGPADLFSPRSSRIVRALLAHPERGWRLSELAIHPDVAVSMGLASKIKRTLLEQGYAVERARLLYLRDPAGLLESWARRYSGPTAQVSLYFRGDTQEARDAVLRWCLAHRLECAAAGFSAAWQLAPEVRHNVATVYLEERAFESELAAGLTADGLGKKVDSGANLQLWRPYDRSVFAGSEKSNEAALPATSALQTYLDLKWLRGRGEDAAAAIYERLLENGFDAAAGRIAEAPHASG
jgi:hypothetical protein